MAETGTFCPLCVSRCGATATVEDGRLLALRPAPEHPTGRALCVKGKAAPEIVAESGPEARGLTGRGARS